MKITILGSGTSHGIPVVGCSCPVCISENIKNKRTRASILVSNNQTKILVDTATEFRLQAVREGITRLDGILYTHSHADHLHGIDDIRSLSREKTIPIYGQAIDLEEIQSRFPYIFQLTPQKGGGKPAVTAIPINKEPFKIGSIEIQPIEIKHGILNIFGYIFNKQVAYLTDCSAIPKASLKLLKNLDIVIIGALRYKPHPTHFSIDQALGIIKKISPNRAYLTHLCHDIDHEQLIEELPKGVFPAYDGLKITSDSPVFTV